MITVYYNTKYVSLQGVLEVFLKMWKNTPLNNVIGEKKGDLLSPFYKIS